jgi:uncharacterized membrane protein YdjX (TVP38/TMEM64 family)
MNKEQILKILKVCIVATIFMLLMELLFSISYVSSFFSRLIANSNGAVVMLVVWVIMFLQVTILNIPAYSVLSVCISIGINAWSWEFILTVVTAYMAGCVLAYWLGRWFGVKAVKWCAGSDEDFHKWSNFINKKGKTFYFLTILLPIFPDDLLCLVAGSVKFHFGLYTILNLVGRFIGLITMIWTLKLIGLTGSGSIITLIFWVVALLAEIICYIIVKKGHKN